MANIALNKPSGGQLILSPEDGTSTETVTIPSVGVGKVLQVVRHEWTTYESTTSGNWTDFTASSFSFTPVSATSKLHFQVQLATQTYAGTSNFAGCSFRLIHDGSAIYTPADYEFYINGYSGSINQHDIYPLSYSTNSNGTQQRQIYLQGAKNSGDFFTVNPAGSFMSSITVMEVAA